MSGRKKQEDSGGPGLGSWLAAGLAAGAVAGAAYLAKKAYDAFKEEEKLCQERESAERKARSLENDAHVYDDRHYDDSDDEGATALKSSPGTYQSQSEGWRDSGFEYESQESLHDSLGDYCENYAKVPQRDMDVATRVAEEVKDMVVEYFHENLPNLAIGELMNTGSSTEGLKVIRPDEFDVLIPLTLDMGGHWELVDGEDTFLNVPGFRMVRQKMPGSAYDRYTVGQFLSPDKVRSAFQGTLQKVINVNSKYRIFPSVHGPAVTLGVEYYQDGEKRRLSIDFVPAIIVGDKWSVAKPHTKFLENPRENAAYANFWRKSYSLQETQKLCNLSRRSCHRECLIIMKAIRLNNHSQFGMLSSYVLKTILLYMLDEHPEEDWTKSMLTERVLDFLQMFSGFLMSRKLKPYFEPNENCNLLDDFHPDSLTKLRDFIQKRFGEEKIKKLLLKNV